VSFVQTPIVRARGVADTKGKKGESMKACASIVTAIAASLIVPAIALADDGSSVPVASAPLSSAAAAASPAAPQPPSALPSAPPPPPSAPPPPPPPPPMHVWTGAGQLGFVASQGNSPAKSANAVLDASYTAQPWTHMFHFDFLYSESAEIVSAERWDALWQSNYNLTSDLFVFGQARYGHDLFDGFQYQATGTAGFGYNFIKTASITLSAQLGAGYLAQRPEALMKNAAGAVTERTLEASQNGAIVTAGLNYSQKISSTTTLTDSLLVYGGSGNSLITNNLALVVKMSTKFALSLGYNIQDNTQPPPGLKSLDTFESVNLVYSF
jgi:putative salt-induced outer membrane protein